MPRSADLVAWSMPKGALLCCSYTRADGIAMLILRRSDVMSTPRWAAREPYAQVVNIGTNNDGHTKEGITFPSSHAQGSLARQASCLSSSDQSINVKGCPQDIKRDGRDDGQGRLKSAQHPPHGRRD